MDIVYYNTSKAYLSAYQYRNRMERKLKMILNEDRIVGPLDPFIRKCAESGKIDASLEEPLIQIAKYCDRVVMSTDSQDFPSFKELKSWSDIIEKM